MKTYPDSLFRRRLIDKAKKLKKEKDCLVLVHNYQNLEVQQIADKVGDSLELALTASKTNHKLVLLCGIKIMAESVKLLNPRKKVLLSHPSARCPLAEMKKVNELYELKAAHPEAEVVCYVNSTIDLRAESTVTCTSGNACQVINSLPQNKEIIFIPDKNLGSWAAYKTGRNLIMWEGYCDVHDQISLNDLFKLREKYPEHLLAVHPECRLELCKEADAVCSTSQMIEYAKEHDKVIIGTEIGLYNQLAYHYPKKDLIPLSKKMICADMAKNTLEISLNILEQEDNEIHISRDMKEKANRSLNRMFELLN